MMHLNLTTACLLAAFSASTLAATEYQTKDLSVKEHMRQEIDSLGSEKNFGFVDLQLTSEQLALLEQIQFNPGNRFYDCYGDIEHLQEELTTFLQQIGNNREELVQMVADIIATTTQNVIEASDKETAWLSIRVTSATSAYDMPRWHMDGHYFGLKGDYPPTDKVVKFATVLKGRTTLFYPVTPDLRAIFETHRADRKRLSHLFQVQNAESPQLGQGAFFIVGDQASSALHSEPKKDSFRLFFSVLAGKKAEIAEWTETLQRNT